MSKTENTQYSPIDEAKLMSCCAPRTNYFQDELQKLREENQQLREKCDDYKKLLDIILQAVENTIRANKAINFTKALEDWLQEEGVAE